MGLGIAYVSGTGWRRGREATVTGAKGHKGLSRKGEVRQCVWGGT